MSGQFKTITDIPPYHLRARVTTNSVGFRNQVAGINSFLQEVLPPNLSLNGQHYFIFSLQYIWGLRISEVLRITHGSITPGGIVLVQPSKRSNPRFIFAPWLLALKSDRVQDTDLKLFTISYKAYYLQLMRHNLFTPAKPGGKKNLVTHLSRHVVFEEVGKHFNINKNMLAIFSGHSKPSSLKYYTGKNSATFPHKKL